ncbi:MAG TPA: hypothetical protein VE733_22520 [Streptosporangiaceae bacterium]|nr:hypothetical protein [Streptosporangiaceae bacterium]
MSRPAWARPGLRFRIDAILGGGDLVAVVGAAIREPQVVQVASALVWLIRLEDGRMAEMWTYRDSSR